MCEDTQSLRGGLEDEEGFLEVEERVPVEQSSRPDVLQFQQAMAKVQELFPEWDMSVVKTNRERIGLAESLLSRNEVLDKDAVSFQLPLSPGMKLTFTGLRDDLLAGLWKEGKVIKPKFFPSFDIKDFPRSKAVDVNCSFLDLLSSQQARKGKGIGSSPILFSKEDVGYLEVTARRLISLSNSLDWFLASMVKPFSKILELNQDQEIMMDLEKFLFLASKSVSGIQGESISLLANVLTKRRSAVCKLLPGSISHGEVKKLCLSDFSASELFADEDVAKAKVQLEASTLRESQLSMIKSGKSGFGGRPFSSRFGDRFQPGAQGSRLVGQTSDHVVSSPLARLDAGSRSGVGIQNRQQSGQFRIPLKNNRGAGRGSSLRFSSSQGRKSGSRT